MSKLFLTKRIWIDHIFCISAKILTFYVIFYACLSAFFAGLLGIFFTTLNDENPKWKLNEGLIGSNPGLGFRPMPPDSNVESTLIWYKVDSDISYWVEEIERFLDSK